MRNKRIKRTCRTCSKLFLPNKKTSAYCSRECYLKNTPPNPNKEDYFATCEFCSQVYRIPKHRVSKTRFCSRSCQNKWLGQNLTPKWNEHYNYINGASTKLYRREAFAIHGTFCSKCGSVDDLVVHHLDHDRLNNPLDGSNWEVLCRDCHIKYHKSVQVTQKERLHIPKNKLIKTNVCLYCQKEFHPHRKQQVCCSHSCAQKLRYSKQPL